MAESEPNGLNGGPLGQGSLRRSRSAATAQSRELVARATEAVAASRARVDEAEERVRRVLGLLLTSQRIMNAANTTRTYLREAVESYAHLVAAEGMSPERMLVHLKTSVYDAEDALSKAPDREQAKALMQDVVRWSVDAYYAA